MLTKQKETPAMKEITILADIPNATAIDFGPLSGIRDYVLQSATGVQPPPSEQSHSPSMKR